MNTKCVIGGRPKLEICRAEITERCRVVFG